MGAKSKFANPRTDVAFKKLFGVQKDSMLTISFLNAILNRQQGERIVSLDILDGANFPERIGSKKTFIDVKCADEKNRVYIVEIQVAPEDDFFDRALYYSSKNISNQLDEGDRYQELDPVIFIGILDFVLFKQHERYFSRHQIKDNESNEVSTEKMSFNFVELPKFEKKLEDIATDMDLWIYFMKKANQLKIIPERMQGQKAFKKAFDILERSKWTAEEEEAYEVEIDEERCRKSQFETAITEGREKGLQEGLEKGLQEGLKKGLQEGLEKGLKEGLEKSKCEIIKAMLENGLDESSIVKMTGLSLDMIRELKKIK